ncbi:hypothetical protein [Collinsella ihumii]|uniref:FeoB-associated Cys-rich membrane protein n=1 Tax=Collinsella ihumii TaxID=1720204 RepID=A0AAW7K5L1_9ACTN|nr:hypothetical protein [Collinsella ihumii]MDN0070341.1 hypothetical protein [Collinsella ihumii]
MSPIDFIILAAIGVAFVAVCVRIKRKGSCADCAQGGTCSGHCGSSSDSCPACQGVDCVAERLSRGIK